MRFSKLNARNIVLARVSVVQWHRRMLHICLFNLEIQTFALNNDLSCPNLCDFLSLARYVTCDLVIPKERPASTNNL